MSHPLSEVAAAGQSEKTVLEKFSSLHRHSNGLYLLLFLGIAVLIPNDMYTKCVNISITLAHEIQVLPQTMPKSSANATAKGPFLFSLAMLISGSIGLFVRLIDLSPINIVFFRCAFGAIALGIYVLSFKRNSITVPHGELVPILGCGLVLVANWVFLFAAFKQTSITVAVSIYYLAPVLVTLYGLLLGQPGTKAVIFGILLAFLGAALVSGITIKDILGLNLLGASYAFCAAVLYAALILLSKRVKHTDSAVTALVQTTVGTLMLSFFADFDIVFVDLNWGVDSCHRNRSYSPFIHLVLSWH